MPLLPSKSQQSSNDRPDLAVAYNVRAKAGVPAKKTLAAKPSVTAPQPTAPVKAAEVTPKDEPKIMQSTAPTKKPALTRIEAPRMVESPVFKVKPRAELEALKPKTPVEASPAVEPEAPAVVEPETVKPTLQATVAPKIEESFEDEDDGIQHESIAAAIMARRAKANAPKDEQNELALADIDVPFDDEEPLEDEPSDMISAIRARLNAKRLR